MKMKFKYAAMLAAALTMGMTGCSNNENPAEDFAAGGEPTYMSLNIDFPALQSKAADANAKEGETALKSVDVFIYDKTGAYESHQRLSGDKFTGDQDKRIYTATTEISTTTGEKQIYVGVNLPERILSTVNGKPASALAATAVSMNRKEMSTLSSGLPMFSTVAAEHEMVKDKTMNNVLVAVKRMVAKVTVEEGKADLASSELKALGTIGGSGTYGFAVYNFNERQFLLQSDGPEYKDPNWTMPPTTSLVWDQFSIRPEQPSDWAGVNGYTGLPVAVADYNTLYAAENTSEGKRKGEITRVTVRAKFTPLTVLGGSLDADGTFYAYKKDDGSFSAFYANQAAAQNAADLEPGTPKPEVVTYDEGNCYYHMFLNRNVIDVYQYDVVRNNYFKCVITGINKLGSHTPEIIEPDSETKPDDERDGKEVAMTTVIEVIDWEPAIEDDYELK